MERHHDGHESSPVNRRALGEIRAGLEELRSRLEGIEGEEPRGAEEESPRQTRPGSKLAALAAAAALDVLARRAAGSAVREPRRGGPGFLKLAVFSAAVFAIGKLVTARR